MECTFDNIRKEFDYKHYGSNDYCIEYHVYYNNPSWSAGKWFNIEGITADGSIVDLLKIGYSYQFPWLEAGTYTN